MKKVNIVILAAGHGTRMQHELPKPLVPLLEKPMIQYLLDAIAKTGVCDDPIIVVNPHTESLFRETLGEYTYVLQHEQLGTGHAVQSARDMLSDATDPILVLYGDMPFVSAETISRIAMRAHESEAKLTMTTTIVPDFEGWHEAFYGFSRIIRDADNKVVRTVEKKDATEIELEIMEVNPAYLCFDAPWLWKHIDMISNTNAQQEYYLTDLIKMATDEGNEIATVIVDPMDALGINTPEHLRLCEKVARERYTEDN